MPELPPSTGASRVEIAMAFDYGLRRIGIAVGDTLTRSARPLTAITLVGAHGPTDCDWPRIAARISEIGAHRLIVGCPYNADGVAHAMTEHARTFAAALLERFGKPVELVDERYSSLEATDLLRSQRAAGKRRSRVTKEDIDSAAAAVILERWLRGEH